MGAASFGNRSSSCLFFILLTLGCEGVSAQALPLPPVRDYVDENGVDLMSVSFNVSRVDIGIGPAEASLSYARFSGTTRFSSVQYRASTDILIMFDDPVGEASVLMGGTMEGFKQVGTSSTYTATNGMGSTLVFDTPTQNYVYTRRNGAVVRFPARTVASDSDGMRALSILEPDGTLTQFSNKKWSDPVTSLWYSRVQSVVNNAGYQLKLEYANAVSTDPTKVSVLNRTLAYCDPAADTCAATSGMPFASFAWGQSFSDPAIGLIVPLTATDAAGRQTRWTMALHASASPSLNAWMGPVGMKSTSASTDDTTATFGPGTSQFSDSLGVASVTRRGRTWNYQVLNRLSSYPTVKVTDPNGNTREVTTDLSVEQVISDKDGLGHVTSYQYDSFGRRTRITFPEGNYIQVAYDARGNATETRKVAKPGAAIADLVESASYPATCSNPKTCNKPTSTTDARGQVTDYTYDPTHGGLLTVTEPAPSPGAVRPQTRYSYTPLYAWYKNSAGTLAQSATPIYKLTGISSCRTTASCAGSADEAKTTLTYQAGSSTVPSNLLLVSVTQSSGDDAISRATSFSYDDFGNRVAEDGPLAGAADTTVTRYDILRRVVGVVGPDPDGEGALKRRAIRYSYNLDDQLTTVDHGTVNGLTDPDWSALSVWERVTFGYEASGLRASASIVAGGSILAYMQFSYDAGGRLDCTARRMNPATFAAPPASACALATAGGFGPDRVTRAIYDAAGRVTKIQSGYGTIRQRDETSAAYTANGNMLTVTDARNNVTTYEYDRYDRLHKMRYPSAAGASSNTDFEQFSYDAGSKLIEKRLRDGQTVSFAYDGLGRLQTRNLPGSELDVTYGYDNLGHTTSASQSGHTLTFGYDALGNLRTQTGPQGTLTSGYDAAGRRTRLTWPDAFFVDYDYLATGETSAIRENGATAGSGMLATYGYDNLGRRTTLTRGNGTVTSYQYDAASRLEQLNQDLAATAADRVVGMSYNPAGQISSRTSSNDAYAWTENPNTSRSYTSNALNQYAAVGSVSPTYDARGNLTTFGTDVYGYSSENLLTSAPGGVSLSYDPMGRLYQTSSATVTTRYAHDGNQLVAEYNASNQLLRRYVHGPGADEPLVWYEGNGTGTRRWLHADERGSIVAISDVSGAQFAINKYDEHGVPASTNVGRFQFTGQAWVPEAKLYYFKARFYSPSLGRFMQTDPIGLAAGMNLYAYVRGDVINRRDPSGLMEEVVVTGKRYCGIYCSSLVLDDHLARQDNYLDWIQSRLALDFIADEPQRSPCSSDGTISSFVEQHGPEIGSRALNVISGTGQVLLGGAICSGAVTCVGGGILAAHGVSNVYEGMTGASSLLRQGYRAVLGSAGDLAYNLVNAGTSVYGLTRAVVKPDSWKLFRSISSDHVPAFRTMTGTELIAEGAGLINDGLDAAGISMPRCGSP